MQNTQGREEIDWLKQRRDGRAADFKGNLKHSQQLVFSLVCGFLKSIFCCLLPVCRCHPQPPKKALLHLEGNLAPGSVRLGFAHLKKGHSLFSVEDTQSQGGWHNRCCQPFTYIPSGPGSSSRLDSHCELSLMTISHYISLLEDLPSGNWNHLDTLIDVWKCLEICPWQVFFKQWQTGVEIDS